MPPLRKPWRTLYVSVLLAQLRTGHFLNLACLSVLLSGVEVLRQGLRCFGQVKGPTRLELLKGSAGP